MAQFLDAIDTGAAEYAEDVADAKAETRDVHFALSTEIYDRIVDSTPEALGRCLDIGADWELVEGIREGLETLTGNMGIDLTPNPPMEGVRLVS